MDFLDSFDVDISKYKKSCRVRSWYLYEQFKSLERNQLDATRKLKSRSYQDSILRQELSERRARRRLYNRIGHSQSECGNEPSLKSESTKTSLDVSSDDFYESIYELQNEELTKIGDYDDDDNERNCQSATFRKDNFKSVDDQKDDESYAQSVLNVKSEETLTEDIKGCIETNKPPNPQHIHPHNMHLNFDAVKEKLQCLERLARMRDLDKFSEHDSMHSIEDDELKNIIMQDKNVNTADNNICFMWSKLVSFAYQIMELHHGNCYYDYGSQFLTAVLACDVLRRGINRVCHILQPYVSPLKYSTDSDSSDKNHKKTGRTIHHRTKYSRNYNYKRGYSKNELNKTSKRHFSENILEKRSPMSREKLKAKKYRRTSEPGRRLTVNIRNPSSKTSSSIWPCFTRDDCSLCVKTCTCCCHKVVNPMLHISRYLDKIMRDIDCP